ncbi:energy-coupling factor transporter transmembrane protein EcfT [uncultured Alsobacter sp.]|uniref:energy-coupling factor transporter transmembrane component T family protein n=1 Tax=uncultured Alsobacter sp. TaxID=1748258 RepID=UPI0025D30BAF|nr:energy-coupling factor transporter transmembrane component T [uncultured Alsobacter sp.]
MIGDRHALAKLAASGVLVLTASLVDRLPALALMGVVILVALLALERRPAAHLARRMLPFVFLAAAMSWIYLVAENPAYTAVGGSGAGVAAVVASRILVMGLASLAFAETTRADDLARALEQNARLPRRIVQGVLAAIQFLPALAEDYRMLRLLQPRRGSGWGGRIGARLASLSPDVLLVLFAGALRRASAAALSMQMRGLGPLTPASRWRERRWQGRDSLLVAAAIALAGMAATLG